MPRACLAEGAAEDKRAVEDAPPAMTPAGMKKASASLAKKARAATLEAIWDFMVLKVFWGRT